MNQVSDIRPPAKVLLALQELRTMGGTPEENAVALLTGLSIQKIRELGGIQTPNDSQGSAEAV